MQLKARVREDLNAAAEKRALLKGAVRQLRREAAAAAEEATMHQRRHTSEVADLKRVRSGLLPRGNLRHCAPL